MLYPVNVARSGIIGSLNSISRVRPSTRQPLYKHGQVIPRWIISLITLPSPMMGPQMTDISLRLTRRPQESPRVAKHQDAAPHSSVFTPP